MRFTFLLFSFLGFLPVLRAHSAPGSAVLLDFQVDGVTAELRLPLSELEFGFKQPLEAEPATVVARFRSQLANYVRQHVAARSPDGRAWKVEVLDLEMALNEQPIDLVVNITLRPPAGASSRRFTLNYDAISHEVMNHVVMVSVRRDPRNPPSGGDPELIGVMRSFMKELPVDRAAGIAVTGGRDELALASRASRAPWLAATLALLALVALIATLWPRLRARQEISP